MMQRTRRSLTRIAGLAALSLALVGGCGGKGGKGSSTETALAEQPLETPPTVTVGQGPLLDMVAPQDVWVYGGVDAMAAVAQKLQGALGMPGGGGPGAGAMFSKPIAKKLGLTSGAGLDLAKPLRFAVVDPRGGEKAIMIVPMTSREAFNATLPDHRSNEKQNAYAFGEINVTFVNFVGDFAVFTRRPETFATYREFIGRLAGATLPAPLAVLMPVKNAAASLGPELAAGLELAKREMPMGAMGGMGQGGEIAAKMLDWIVSAAKDLDRLLLTATFEEGAIATLDVTPKAGSELEKTFRALGGHGHKLLARLPADAPAVMSVSIDPDKASELGKELYAMMGSLEGAEGPIAAELATVVQKYGKAMTGDGVFAAYSLPDGGGLAVSGIMGVRDARAAREAKAAMDKMRDDPRWKDVIGKRGLHYNRETDAFKVGGVSFDTTTMELDPDRLHGLKPAMAGILGSFMHQASGIGDEAAYYTFGAEPQKSIEALLGPKAAGGLDKAPGIVRALQHAAPNSFFVAYARVLDLLKSMKLPETAELGILPPSEYGIALSFGVKDSSLRAVLELPTEQVALAMQMMMMRMPSPGAPKPLKL